MPNKYEEYMQQLDQIDKVPFDGQKIYEDWSTSKKPVLDIIMSNYKRPEIEIDPEQARRAKYASSITDALTSIGEMFAHGSGAYVRNRAGQPTSTQRTNATIQSARDKYEQQMQKYQSVKGNAMLQDFNQYLQNKDKESGNKRNFIIRKAEQEHKSLLAEQARKEQMEKEQRALKDKKELIEYESKFKPKSGTKGSAKSEPKISPDEVVSIQAASASLPPEWVAKQGYMNKKETTDPVTRKTKITYTWDAKATPAIRKALVEKYNKEKKNDDPLNLGL